MKAGFIPAFSLSVKLQVLLHETFYAIDLAPHIHNPVFEQDDFLVQTAAAIFDYLLAETEFFTGSLHGVLLVGIEAL